MRKQTPAQKPAPKPSSLKKVYYRSVSFLIVIPLLLVFCVAVAVVGYKIRNTAIGTLNAFQDSVATTLVNDIKTASLQLSHFAYVNEGEFMALAAQVASAEKTAQYQASQQLERAFRTAMVPSQAIVAGRFYLKGGGGVSMKDDITLPDDAVREEGWYRRAVEKPNTVVLGSYDTSKTDLTSTSQKGRQLALVTAMSPNLQTDKSGSIDLLAFFTVSNVGEVIAKARASAHLGVTVLLDGENRLVYGDMGNRQVLDYFAQNSALFAPGSFTQRAQLQPDEAPRSYFFKTRAVPMTDWKIVTFVPAAALNQGFTRIGLAMVLAILALLGLFYLFSRYFLNAIITPVHRVAEGMQQLVENDLDVQVRPVGQSEIRTLMESFNQMVRSLKHMLLVNEEAQKRKHNAEIEALQSQINPHFVVNALNSIRFMAQVAKFDGIRKMAEALISIVSCSFRGNISFYAVQEELAVLDSYLYLMRIRYADGFDVEYDVQPDCLSYRLPRLTLQPIVENSITHGFAELEDALGHLTIKVYKDDESLYLSVRDNGKGMTPAQIDEVLHGRPRPENDNHSIGLQNVLARIRLHFGAKARMTVDSVPGAYTHTVIRLPLLPGETLLQGGPTV